MQTLTRIIALVSLLALDSAVLAQTAAPEAQGGGAPADAKARELYLRGDALYAQGEYAQAIDAFKQAHELSGRPLLLFNLANAYERNGDYAQAADALRRYTPTAPDSERGILERRIENLEGRARAAADAAPEPVAQPEPAPQPAAVATAPQPDPAPASASPPPADTSAEVEPASDTMSTLAWTLTVGGGVLMLAGTAAAVVALDARAEAEESCVAATCRGEARDAVDRDANASLLADIGLFGGAATAAAGLIMLWTLGPSETAQHARLQVGRDSLQLGYASTF